LADRRLFTDRFLKSLRPAPKGTRVEIWDSRLAGFGVRVSDREDTDPARRGKAGKINFLLYARFTPDTRPTRRPIGVYGEISLDEARDVAGEWRSMIAKGIDPAVVEAEAKAEAARQEALRAQHSFAAVAEDWINDKVRHERKGKEAERHFRSYFIDAWGERPLKDNEITPLDVLAIVNAKKLTAPEMARVLFNLVNRFFNWAIDQRVYGLTASPCYRLKPGKVIGPAQSRNRRLSDAEVRAFWHATGRMRYPTGPLYQLLLLTGLRLNEVARLSWLEIEGDIIVIPAARMKGKNGEAREHLVPLSTQSQDILAALPRFKGGRYLFSYDGGKRPLQVTSKIKRDLDQRMLWAMRALARHNGEDHTQVTLSHWTNHDLRRVVRSGLSALRVGRDVAEAVLAHRPQGVIGVYDCHDFLNEKREALQTWANRVASIVDPKPTAPAKVIRLRGRTLSNLAPSHIATLIGTRSSMRSRKGSTATPISSHGGSRIGSTVANALCYCACAIASKS